MILSATRYMQFVQEFARNIRNRTIEGTWLSEFTVAKIFSKVLPEYPKLQRLDSTRLVLPNNKIKSLTRLRSSNNVLLWFHLRTVRLRCLNLLGNPVLSTATATTTGTITNDELLLRRERRDLLCYGYYCIFTRRSQVSDTELQNLLCIVRRKCY